MKPSLVRLFLFASVLTAVLVSGLSYHFVRERHSFRVVTRGLLGKLDAWLTDEQGRVVASTGSEGLPEAWEQLPRPGIADGVIVSKTSNSANTVLVRRTHSDKPHYFVLRRTAPGLVASFGSLIELILPVVLMTCAVMALALYVYSRQKGNTARAVMGELKAGNLRARFPVGRLDEVGTMMVTFNEMADQIERLVTTIQSAERARNELLRSLAHDLRTPLTSLSLLVESAAEAKSTTPRFVLRRKMQHAQQELAYFKRLLEDLFVLSNLDDPFFVPSTQSFELCEPIFREIDRRHQLSQASGRGVKFSLDLPEQSAFHLTADTYLFERVLRNALDNAEAHARKKVAVKVEGEPGGDGVVLEIRDDGPGLSEAVLAQYGRKHHSRFLDGKDQGRISMGLGSLIMQRIVSHFGGRLKAENWTLPDGRVGGATVRIHLPGKVQLRKAA